MALFREPTLTRSRGFPASTAGAFSIAFCDQQKKARTMGFAFFLAAQWFRYKGRGIDPQAVAHKLQVFARQTRRGSYWLSSQAPLPRRFCFAGSCLACKKQHRKLSFRMAKLEGIFDGHGAVVFTTPDALRWLPPGERVHPEVVQVMRGEGIDLNGVKPRNVSEMEEKHPKLARFPQGRVLSN
jgi:hypothetical protein